MLVAIAYEAIPFGSAVARHYQSPARSDDRLEADLAICQSGSSIAKILAMMAIPDAATGGEPICDRFTGDSRSYRFEVDGDGEPMMIVGHYRSVEVVLSDQAAAQAGKVDVQRYLELARDLNYLSGMIDGFYRVHEAGALSR